MQFLPQHSLQLINAGWFSLIYGIISMSLLFIMRKERRKRILTFPVFNNKYEKLFCGLSLFIFSRGLIVYSFFIPLKLFTVNFYIGSAVYLYGMISSVYAMWIFSQAELSRPVTCGIYKITRHPMQVMSIVMWIGIGTASGNWLLIVFAVMLAIISYPTFLVQERFCTDTYGQEYIEYMNRTPRYLLV